MKVSRSLCSPGQTPWGRVGVDLGHGVEDETARPAEDQHVAGAQHDTALCLLRLVLVREIAGVADGDGDDGGAPRRHRLRRVAGGGGTGVRGMEGRSNKQKSI